MNIVISNVSKSFKNRSGRIHQVLKDMSLEIPAGSVLKIEGASGSGKTTLMNVMSGLIVPDSGKVQIGNIDISTLSESEKDRFRAENIGYIFQTFNLLSPFSVIENVYAPAAFSGKLTANYKEKAAEILRSVGLAGFEKSMPYHLSVGQRQRVAVARVLFSQNKIILADEPTASLDKISSKAVFDSIMKCREFGATVIFSSHDETFSSLIPDKVISLETGGEA
jgi:putative ABC transport system ATP-binding protein